MKTIKRPPMIIKLKARLAANSKINPVNIWNGKGSISSRPDLLLTII